jgi:hypothetical protein
MSMGSVPLLAFTKKRTCKVIAAITAKHSLVSRQVETLESKQTTDTEL